MARRKYKKTKRKLSRKVIHKTRRRTKNRVKKISKNQSGGVITLGTNAMLVLKGEIPSGKKRRRTSASASEAAAASTKRTKPSSPLSDEELGQLVINSLFKKTTDVSFIQDSSRYGFILYGTVPSGILFDTRNLPLREALDIGNIDRSIPLRHFCMKLSLVLDVTDASRFESYDYLDSKIQTHSKRAVSVIRSTKEAHIQKKIYDSFSCISGTSAFVPDVIAHGVFRSDNFERYINLFMSNRLGAATQRENETGTAAGIDDNVLHVLREVGDWLKQKNLDDSRKTDASEKQNWAVDILLMEYIDTTMYQTLYTLGTTTGMLGYGKPSFDLSKIQKALLTTAAQLACATGVGIILYDCHPNNALSNASQDDVRLIDIGGAIDVNNEDDKQSILETFDSMLRSILSGANTFCTIQQLCYFFETDIVIESQILKKQTKQAKQKSSDIDKLLIERLIEKFQENLDTLVDFRCRLFTIEHIHNNLIMTAFVDFMMFIVVYNTDACQSQYTMESVYGAGTFSKFSTFLTQFRPNNITFRSSGTPSDSYGANLLKVGTEISKIVTLCSSVKCAINPEHLRLPYRLQQLPPSEPPSEPPPSAPSLSAPPSAPSSESPSEPKRQKVIQSGCTVM